MCSRQAPDLLALSICVVLLASAGCAPHAGPSTVPSDRIAAPGERFQAAGPSLDSYRGLGTWIDVYGPWNQVRRHVREMERNDVRTLYLETSSFKQPTAILRPEAVGQYIEAAHEAGIDVVAWYNPSFRRLHRDWRRVKRAIGFRSPLGQGFDSFALDIEATVVKNVDRRNRRMLRLSDWIRELVGPGYTLGAIIPDPTRSTYWPGFPYKAVARRYDIWLPMTYYTYRARGYRDVHRFVSDNVEAVRRLSGDPGVLVHVIGGIAGVGSSREVHAFTRAVGRRRAYGASLYDFPLTTEGEWDAMQAIDSESGPARLPP